MEQQAEPGFFEKRAFDLAYELVRDQEQKNRAEILLANWIEEAEAGFIHAGKVEWLTRGTRNALAGREIWENADAG
jgi:hypothetical protein